MIWQNPIAWLGFAALAVPILVHLFTRRVTRRVSFPTLRFLAEATQATTRRWRLTDLALLALRAAVIALAVGALAQPLLITSARTAAVSARVVRAVVVDVSQSMGPSVGDGSAPVDRARREAEALTDEADVGLVVESARVGADLAGAAAWLDARAGRRELIVISDFQAGAMTSEDLETLVDTIGIKLMRIETTTPQEHRLSFRHGDRETVGTFTAGPASTTVTWHTRTLDEPDSTTPILLAGSDGRDEVLALFAAGRRLAQPGPAPGGPIGIVLPDYPAVSALLDRARPIDEPWMFDVVDSVRRDEAGSNQTNHATPFRTGAAEVDGIDRLLFFVDSVSPPETAAVILAGIPAPAADPTELEPGRLDDDTLRGWERDAAVSTPTAMIAGDGESDGAWVWLIVLGMLGFEWLMRRERRTPPDAAAEVRHARVA